MTDGRRLAMPFESRTVFNVGGHPMHASGCMKPVGPRGFDGIQEREYVSRLRLPHELGFATDTNGLELAKALESAAPASDSVKGI